MPTNLILWLLFSFSLLLFFSSFKISPKMAIFFRWFFALLALPSTILSVFSFKELSSSESIFFKVWIYKLLPLNLGIHLNRYNIATILCLLLSFNLFIFIANYQCFSSTILSFTALCFFLAFSQLPSDILVILFILNVGNIFLLFTMISVNTRNFSINITRNFLWLVISDFITMIGLLLALSIYGHSTVYYSIPNLNFAVSFLLFFPCFIKILSLASVKTNIGNPSLSLRISQLSYILFSGCSAVIILLSAQNYIFANLSLTYILLASALVLYGIFQLIVGGAKYAENNISILFSSLAVLFLALGQAWLSQIMLCLMALIFSFQVESISRKVFLTKTIGAETNETLSFDLIPKINFYTSKFIDLMSNLSSNIIGPLYGNFLLLRIPQLIIALIQIPLRLFHNGSIQRSVLFIVIMVLSYYYIWEPQ
jgi:hypothetical protein